VAIPALIAYLFFVGRVDKLVIEIDSLGQQLVALIAGDARPREAMGSGTRPSGNKAA
jgi:biopolymer transport protein ExbB